MAGNTVKLTFAGDSGSLEKASKQSDQALTRVGAAADKSGKDLADASKASTNLGDKMGRLSTVVIDALGAVDAIGGSLQALVDIQQLGAERASRQARAELDVEQAMNDGRQAARDLRQSQLDLNQSRIDGRQAAADTRQAEIDATQATLDASVAQTDYNTAVKEHGKNSAEARQALIDLSQAQADLNQAHIDGSQAQNDLQQSTEDGNQAIEDGNQAATDLKGAVLDLNDAMRAAHPPELSGFAQQLSTFAPLVTAVVGVVGLATSATWLWNAALWANPITWIVATIIVFIAIIVLLATKTTVLQDTWNTVWDFLKGVGQWFAGPFANFFVDGYHKVTAYLGLVKDYVLSLPGQFKSAFDRVTGFITAPFRAAFNYVSDAWNATIGRLHWSVPDWVPGIGGNSLSAPRLPHFHQGGIVPGGLGAETLAVLQAGERVTPMGGGSSGGVVELASSGSDWDDMILKSIRRSVGLHGNDPVRVLVDSRG